MADTLNTLAQSQHYSGRYADAERASGRPRDPPAAPRAVEPPTIGVVLELGDLLHTRGDLVSAEQMLREAIPMLRAASAAREAVAGARDTGNVLRDRGLLQKSDASFREAIRLLHLPDLDTGQQVALTEVLPLPAAREAACVRGSRGSAGAQYPRAAAVL